MKIHSKKDSILEYDDVSYVNKRQPLVSKSTKCILQEMTTKVSKRPNKMISKYSLQDKNKILQETNIITSKPVYEMKIRSALTTSILELRKSILTKTKSMDILKPMQMISVLKKPIIPTITQNALVSNLKESIVTTRNSYNDQVRNIIIEDIAADIKLCENTGKKLPRRKLNLAEYRNRHLQNCSNSSHINSIQPMIITYIHHVSTNTEPINDDSDNLVWTDREIVLVLKPKSEIEKQRLNLKRSTRDRGIQTNKTVFGVSFKKNEVKKLIKRHGSVKQKQPTSIDISNEININNTARIKQEFIVTMLNHKNIKNSENKNHETTNRKNLKDDIEIFKIDLISNEQKAVQTSRYAKIYCI
jgi:hypothetical protein